VGADATVLAALHASCFDDPWHAELIGRVLGSPGGFGFLARLGPDVVGFTLCRSAAGEGEVLTLCVAAPSRRRGVGRALLSAAIETATRRGLASLFLEVAENNIAGRALYAGFGFESVGRRSGYYRNALGIAVDALTLRCSLGFGTNRAISDISQ
jgi:ribosomal-protein-alanine N-acetyltransferase